MQNERINNDHLPSPLKELTFESQHYKITPHKVLSLMGNEVRRKSFLNNRGRQYVTELLPCPLDAVLEHEDYVYVKC